MDRERMHLLFNSSLGEIAPVNSSFDRAVLRIAYHGYNRNNSYIAKETFEKAFPTIYNCPIVCNYMRESDTIGGHDVEFVGNGSNMKLVNITTPVGVVPESAKFVWETVEENDGTVHEYMTVPVLLWKRQEVYQHLKDNCVTDESMEINVNAGERRDDGCFYIHDFEFTAFCLLEEVEPCFESAGIEMFSLDSFKKEYSSMMEDLLDFLTEDSSKVTAANTDDINVSNDTDNYSKGGDGQMDYKNLMEEYGLTEEDVVGIEFEGMSDEEVAERFDAIRCSKASESGEETGEYFTEKKDEEEMSAEEVSEDDAEGEENDEDYKCKKKVNCSLNSQLIDGIVGEISRPTFVHERWGECNKYGFMDFDAEACKVYAMNIENDYIMVAIDYHMDGDNVVIDFDTEKRVKIAYVDYEEGDQNNGIANEFAKKTEQYGSVVEDLASVKAEFDSAKEELESLRAFKANVDEQARKSQENEVFANFSDLNGNERFESLKNECSDMSIEDIEEKCFAIRGRMNSMKFSQQEEDIRVRIPVERNNGISDEPYGGVFVKYGIGNR